MQGVPSAKAHGTVPAAGAEIRPFLFMSARRWALRFAAASLCACVVLRIRLKVRPAAASCAAAGASAASADAAGVSGVSAGFSAAVPGVSPDGCAASCVCATLFGVSADGCVADCVCATANPIPKARPTTNSTIIRRIGVNVVLSIRFPLLPFKRHTCLLLGAAASSQKGRQDPELLK